MKFICQKTQRHVVKERNILTRAVLSGNLMNIPKRSWKKSSPVPLQHYAAHAEEFLKDEPIDTEAHLSYVSYEPLGAILGIMPWNYPFWQAFRFVVPTLMAGNSVVLKHSSNVQNCARHIEDIFKQAGLPQFVFSNLVAGSHKVNRIIEHDAIKAVSSYR